MIHEYALEPALVAGWHDRKQFAFFEEKFGVSSRRLVSLYPGKWKRLVWAEFQKTAAASDENARHRLDALLAELTQEAVKRRASFEDLPSWLERAESEHRERPFHAILAELNPRGNEAVLEAARLLEAGHALWRTPEQGVVVRRASELASLVAPILRRARELAFVDPYFDPGSPRYCATFARFMAEIRQGIFWPDRVTVEVHTSLKRVLRDTDDATPDELRRAFRGFRTKCEKRIPALLPPGLEVTFYVWRRRPGGEQLHNRYILSDMMGVTFGVGLDEEVPGFEDSETGATDDVSILTSAQFTIRRQQYSRTSRAFHPVESPFSLTGIDVKPDRAK